MARRGDELFLEERVHDRHQQMGVGAGDDRDPLVGLGGGLRPTRIDHDDLPATGAQRLEPAREVGRGAEAAIRRVGVGAHDHEVVGTVDVGHGHARRRAEHVGRGNLLRHLIDRACREPIRVPIPWASVRAYSIDERLWAPGFPP